MESNKPIIGLVHPFCRGIKLDGQIKLVTGFFFWTGYSSLALAQEETCLQSWGRVNDCDHGRDRDQASSDARHRLGMTIKAAPVLVGMATPPGAPGDATGIRMLPPVNLLSWALLAQALLRVPDEHKTARQSTATEHDNVN
jgi:hypothetical protein